MKTKVALRSERTALLAHDAACTAILQALASGNHDKETVIALWRGKPIWQIAEALGNEHDHDIFERFTQQELNGLISAGPTNFASQPEEAYSCLSSSAETQTFADTEPGCGLGLGHTPTMPRATDETARKSQLYRGDSYSAILENKWEPYFDTPIYFAQDEARPIALGSGLERISPRFDSEGGNKNETYLKVMPFEITCELLEIFFQEQYIPFPMIVKDLFWADFMAGEKHYCSIALVRIICCLACRIRNEYDLGPGVPLSNQLWNEASRLVGAVNFENSMPNAQTLALMSLHQLGAGQYGSAQVLAEQSVARLALLFSDLDNEFWSKNSVEATTLYSAIALARMTRLAIGYLTNLRTGLEGFSIMAMSKEPANERVEQLLRNTGLDEIAQSHALYQRSASACRLTGWIYSCMSRSQIAVGASLPAHVKDTYRACLEWYQSNLKHGGGIWDADPFIQEICYQLKDFHIPCFVPLFVYAAGMVDKYTVCAVEDHLVSPGRASAQFTGNRGDTTVGHDCNADSLSVLLGDDRTAPCSLTDRALGNLIQLSDTYPSARELALELESEMIRRYSISAVGDENSQE